MDDKSKVLHLIEKADKVKVENFKEILDKIENLNDEKKKLWIEIYSNAIADRQNAYMMFNSLVDICGNASTEHAVHGRTISSFIERMSKANDQLIKLAELVRKAEEKDEEIDENYILDQINNG